MYVHKVCIIPVYNAEVVYFFRRIRPSALPSSKLGKVSGKRRLAFTQLYPCGFNLYFNKPVFCFDDQIIRPGSIRMEYSISREGKSPFRRKLRYMACIYSCVSVVFCVFQWCRTVVYTLCLAGKKRSILLEKAYNAIAKKSPCSHTKDKGAKPYKH